jgi:hypothetical protein
MDATAKPYLEKVQATTKPYTDAAAAKAKEVIEKIEVGRDGARRGFSFSLAQATCRLACPAPAPCRVTELHDVPAEPLWAVAAYPCPRWWMLDIGLG